MRARARSGRGTGEPEQKEEQPEADLREDGSSERREEEEKEEGRRRRKGVVLKQRHGERSEEGALLSLKSLVSLRVSLSLSVTVGRRLASPPLKGVPKYRVQPRSSKLQASVKTEPWALASFLS